MIYLDVTSAASSRVSTGVQRVIRGIYAGLADNSEVKPVRWDFLFHCYSVLSEQEERNLRNPFEKSATRDRPVDDGWLRGGAFVKSQISRSSRRIPNQELLASGNLLLIPDLCWDWRIYSWDRMSVFPAKKVAIFHDAMPLRIKGQALSVDKVFADYVRKLGLMDLVICISSEVEEDLLRYWREFDIPARPTTVLHWPVPFTGTRPKNPPNRQAANLMYVSRLRLRKNHLVLLEACERLWSEKMVFSLDFIGIADTVIDTFFILGKVRKLTKQGRPVRWLGQVSDTELHQAYQNASFTLFPSKMEGFGLPILESLWHRRPVICGNNGAIGEVSSGGGCLHVDQNDPAQIAAAIRTLLADDCLYERLYHESQERNFRTWNEYFVELRKILGLFNFR